MTRDPPAGARRCAVVDLGSNSVRLVVFEGLQRNPLAIFNEKATLRLGRGLTGTGRLNEQGVAQAVPVLARYHAVARAMDADPFEVLATSAVRDAENGPEFIAALREVMPGTPIRVLPGEEEAALSAAGVLCGIPEADGILADIGGGSLELVPLDRGRLGEAATLRLGAIRLADRSGGEMAKARSIAETDLAGVPWLAEGRGRSLYLVGGAWRALARVHMMQTAYPLTIVHQYTLDAATALGLAAQVAGTPRRALDRLPGVPRRRAEDLPYAAVVLRRLLRATDSARVVFSADGIREGWFMQRVPPAVRAEDPVLAAARDLARQLGRDPALPPRLAAWTAPLFVGETANDARLRDAACWVSDTGSHDHPEYRAEQSFLRVLRLPSVALDHPSRAFLALVLALRYEAEPGASFLAPARLLLDPVAMQRAERLGAALRLAYTLSAGTPDLLAATALGVSLTHLTLWLAPGAGVFAGEGVTRRLERLAQACGLVAGMEGAENPGAVSLTPLS
jgi:exopolyphosphatase/guanosine-5'-triphosphate,3'-diphosphate pyrophosphatase